jgi:Flp pilus assembly protein TadG
MQPVCDWQREGYAMLAWFSWRKARFKGDERGVIALLFAILALPLFTVTGVAIDYGQFVTMKQRLVSAVDAAALTVGGTTGLTDAQAAAQAQAFITANFPALTNIATIKSVTCTRTTGQVVVAINVSMNTNFLSIAGYSTLDTTVTSQVSVAMKKLEVVLVLDNTSSMAYTYGSMSGMNGLKAAATALVDRLFAADPTGQYVKVAVVPFTATVNVGTQYATANWIDAAGAGSLTRENLNIPAGIGLIDFAKKLQNATWGGCVRARTEPYDVTEVAPAASVPDTLYTPYFAPSEPSGLINHYLPDGTFPNGTTPATIQYDVKKYTNGYVQYFSGDDIGYGPNYQCTVQPLIRLTNNKTAILNEINAMYPYGITVIPVGLMWGWHLLSPNGPFGDGVDYSDNSTTKVIILVTDGHNYLQSWYNFYMSSTANSFNKSTHSAYGYATGPHLTINALPASLVGVQDQGAYNLDVKELQLCENIKAVTDAKGNPGRIQLYTIGFGTSMDARTLTMLQQCATDANHYFYMPTSQELIATTESIGLGLTQLRISK